jgi:carboxyl-terminal processing protease
MFTTPAAALPFWGDAALKGTVVLVLAFALARCLRRGSASCRALMWTMTMVALLAIPLFSLLPAWQASVMVPSFGAPPQENVTLGNYFAVLESSDEHAPSTSQETANPPRAEPAPVAAADIASTRAWPVQEEPVSAPAAGSGNPLATWLAWIWVTGVLLSGMWLLGGWWALGRLQRACSSLRDGPLYGMLDELARERGLRRPLRLLLSNRRAIPMTWGVWPPVILLPEEAQGWSAARLRLVLMHELGHVERWDCLTQLVAHLARGFYWFHPLAWLAVRQLRMEQEQACDDLVLESGASAADYAEHLLAVTAGVPAALWTAPVALGMGRAERLRRRLVGLLDTGRNRRPARRRTLLAAVAVTAALMLPFGTMTLSLAPTAAHAEPPQSKEATFSAPRSAPLAEAQGQVEQTEEGKSEKDAALLKKLSEVRDKLAKYSVVPLDDKALAEQALKGLLKGLQDPYSDYLSADELNSVESQLKGKLSGIGAQLKIVNERLTVTTPLEGSPALKAGLRPGDIIESIDGKETRGLPMNAAVERILGPAGTVVKLKIVHPEGVVEELAVTRGEIRLRTVTGFRRGPDGGWQFLLEPQHGVGYLQVHQFARGTAQEVREAVQAMQKEGLKGLILDLRFCPGGLLDQAVEVCKLFLAEGLIVTLRGQAGNENVFRADGSKTLGAFPMLLLINEQTASAAEIVAGALRDHGRAVLLGSRTYGKGSVQTLLMLDEGGAVKITSAYHYLPSGRNIQKRPGEKTWGVDPTAGFYLPLTAAQNKALREDAEKRALLDLKKANGPQALPKLTPNVIEKNHGDPQLAAALRSMTARLTGGEFLKVGKDDSVALDQVLRFEEMRQRREELTRQMQQLEREISDLQQGAAGDKVKQK